MAQPHVPTSLDQITAEVMTDALRSSGFDEVTVSSVSAERIAIGEGFLGELARLTLDYSAGTGPATAIAKIPTTDSGLKPIGDLLDVYGREHRAYANLLPQMKVRTPQAYLNVGDDESLAYCLVLEDVGGYASGDHHAGATLEQARAAVVAAAGVHGRWWNQVEQFDWVPPIDSPLNMGLQGMFESSWPMVVDQHGEQLGAEVIARLESYLPTVSDMFASFGASSRTLTHNDFRLDNMFFDDDDLVLIDWQLLGRGDGMGDVVPFLTCNLDPALRRAHESDLIDLYRDTLETMDAGYVHLDDLMNAYKLTLNFWLSAWLHNSVTKGETTQRGEELFERIITRTLDAYVEHEAWELIGAHDLSPEMR